MRRGIMAVALLVHLVSVQALAEPSRPAIVPSGEPFSDFASLATTAQGPVLSVAWSPDGKRLATASFDGSTRLWDQRFGLEWILISGFDGRWLGCHVPRGRCWRHDDGALLRRLEGGLIRPVPPPAAVPAPDFVLAEPIGGVFVADGSPLRRRFLVRNRGGDAYAVRLVLADAGSGGAEVVSVARITVPSRPLVKGGETELEIGLVASGRYENPEPGSVDFQLKLLHAHGQQDLGRLKVDLRMPRLEIAGAELRSDEKGTNLTIGLRNVGTAPTGRLIVDINASTGGSAPVSQGVEDIGPSAAKGIKISYSLTPEQAELVRNAGKISLLLRSDPSRRRASGQTATPQGPRMARIPHKWTLSAPVTIVGPRWLWIAASLAFAFAVAYAALVLRNPLVVAVSADPATILRLPLHELPRARRLLFLTGRLGQVLSAADVPRPRLDRALEFLRRDDAQRRARQLAERLELRGDAILRDGPKQIRMTDLKTPQSFLLNLPLVRLAFAPDALSAEDILAGLRSAAAPFGTMTVAITISAARAETLRRTAADRTELVAALSSRDLTAILLASDPLRQFARALAEQAPPSRLSAYQRGGGVSRAAAFFGRETELSNILNREPANYFLVGGRQVGKSSLMKEVERRLKARGGTECVYFALADADLGSALARSLELSDETVDAAIAELGRPGAPQRWILIDEADFFVEADAERGYQMLAVFRKLSEERRAYFMLSGFWVLYRGIAFDYASPIRNFGEQIRLGALDGKAAHDLATKPMDALGLSYAHESLVDRIYRQTGGRANLMVTVCDEIIKRIGREDRVISAELVDGALRSSQTLSQLEGWDTLSHETDRSLDRIVVYATVTLDSFTVNDVQGLIARTGLRADAADIRQSLERLSLAFIIDRGGDLRYRYCVPLFVEMLQELDLTRALAGEVEKAGGV